MWSVHFQTKWKKLVIHPLFLPLHSSFAPSWKSCMKSCWTWILWSHKFWFHITRSISCEAVYPGNVCLSRRENFFVIFPSPLVWDPTGAYVTKRSKRCLNMILLLIWACRKCCQWVQFDVGMIKYNMWAQTTPTRSTSLWPHKQPPRLWVFGCDILWSIYSHHPRVKMKSDEVVNEGL